jgi:hypothetical protein
VAGREFLEVPSGHATRSKTAEAAGKKVGDEPLFLEVELTPHSPRVLSSYKKIPPATTSTGSKECESTPQAGPSMPRLKSSRSSKLRKYWVKGVQQLSRHVRVMDRTVSDADRARSRSKTSSTSARSPLDSGEEDESEDDEDSDEEEDESEESEEEDATYRDE